MSFKFLGQESLSQGMQDVWSVVDRVQWARRDNPGIRIAAIMSYTEAGFSIPLGFPEKCFVYSTKNILEIKIKDKCLCTNLSSTWFA